MTVLSTRVVPWLATSVTASVAALGYVLLAANGAPDLAMQVATGVSFIAYALVGSLIASRRPDNPIGWILIGTASFTGFGFAAEQYARLSVASPEPMPLAGVAAWLASWLWHPGFGLLGLGLLLFPTGRLPSGRWRPVLWLLTGSMIAVTVLFAFSPIGDSALPANPLGLLPPALAAALEVPVTILFAVWILAAASAPLVRLRRARGIERLQLKWFFSAAALLAIVVFVESVASDVLGSIPGSWIIFPIALATIPAAIGVAILRHRLFDIDLIINRTLVYAALTVFLGAAYAVAVLVLQAVLNPIAGGGPLAVAAATLAVAALFQPARRRIQGIVDRRFYRSRYDVARTVEAFSLRLRDELDLATLTDELAGVAGRAMQPSAISVWLRRGDGRNDPGTTRA